MRLHFIALVFALALMGATAGAQTAGDNAATVHKSAVVQPASADKLVLFSRPVSVFRGTLLGVSSRDRVARARTRIHDQLALPGPHLVSVKSDTLGMLIQIDGATSFVLTPADLDPAREESLEQVAQRAATALTVAISESVESRSLETLTRALALAVAGTAAYAALVWLAARGRRALARWLIALTERHTAGLHVGGVALLQRDRLGQLVRLILTLLYRLLVLLATIEWISFV
ncbi:MAG: hypothetical protein KAX88_04900, partial [Rhodoferax sp.]|nr:hypothetical protein [Rhodoferax sp.]